MNSVASGLLSLLLVAPAVAQVPGACTVQDGWFQTGSGGCTDLISGQVWSARAPGAWTWSAAVNYCQNLVEAGFADWRLPTLAELTALQQHGGYTHLGVDPGHYLHWSSTTRGTQAWALFLDTGASQLIQKRSFVDLFCVRTPAGPAAQGGASGGVTVTHLHGAQGWRLLLEAPGRAHVPYLLLASVAGASPVVLGTGADSAWFDPGPGRLDQDGRLALRLDLVGLGLPAAAVADQ